MFNKTTLFLFTVQISPTSVTGNIYSIRLFMNFCQHQIIQMYQNKHSFYIAVYYIIFFNTICFYAMCQEFLLV